MENQNQYNRVENFQGRCFEMKQISEDTVMLRCSFLSRARDKNDKSKGYINGLNMAVMCRVVASENNPACDIKEMDYTNKNISVWGRMYASESTGKDGKVYTNFNIQADKVVERVFENSNGNGGGQQGGWGNNG